MPTPARPEGELIFIGPPGVGKGTQARLLADRHGWLHLATGDLFREHVGLGTELGKLAETYMSKGLYVPDEITVGMVRSRLSEIDAGRRVIFDGFPRTVAQAGALDALLETLDRHVARVVLIEVPRDELLRRVGARATCTNCQTVYSLAVQPPKVNGVCDRCGSTVVATARADDAPEVVRRRLEEYDAQTKPVVEHYSGRGLLSRVDGVGRMEEVTERLFKAIAA
ncbi:MAG: adenylate kinase [Chloroflexota bacterium]|nr:adenylate kinase [Chloroflexota bacterium]